MSKFLYEKQNIRIEKLEKLVVPHLQLTGKSVLDCSKNTVPLRNTKEVDVLRKRGM